MPESVTTLPDAELARNVEQGESVAEGAIYEKYADRVFFLALGEVRSREDAEDIRTETFLRVFLAVRQGKLRKPESLPSFIVGTALNVIREHVRHKAGTEPLDEQEEEPSSEPSPESVYLNEEARRSIIEVAHRLKSRDREFLRMYYYEERPTEEIASILGVREERLRLIKSRALKRFREIYEKLKRD